MGKGGAILGLIGILIGAGGLVLGYMAWSSLNTIQTEIENYENIDTWYITDNDVFEVTPAYTLLELSNLTITFELTSNASVYMSFTCRAHIYPVLGYSLVYFYYKVDGVRLDQPSTSVGNFRGGSTTDYFSVNLQHFIENIAAGSHNVTMEVSTENFVNKISKMTLFVQSFTP